MSREGAVRSKVAPSKRHHLVQHVLSHGKRPWLRGSRHILLPRRPPPALPGSKPRQKLTPELGAGERGTRRSALERWRLNLNKDSQLSRGGLPPKHKSENEGRTGQMAHLSSIYPTLMEDLLGQPEPRAGKAKLPGPTP